MNRIRQLWHAWALIALAALGTGPVAAELPIPDLAGRVNDLAGMLSETTERALESRLAALEQSTGAQVAVLTVPSLEGEVLEDYSLRVAETWKLGRGKFDDGALLFIARDERQMRLEVGYGLEGTIPDAYAKRVLDDVLRPRFRNGDFDGGVLAAIDVVAGLVEGDDTLPPPSPASDVSGSLGPGAGIGSFLFFLIPMGLFSLNALAARGCVGWFLYVFLMPFWLAFPMAMLGAPIGYVPLALWIVGFPILRAIFGGARMSSFPGGFLGSGGGWSSSSGGFSGGGFSGGGGSFGGGGASGSW